MMRWIRRNPDAAAAVVLVLTVVLTTVLRPYLAPDYGERADEVRDRVEAATDLVVRKVDVNFTSDPSGALVYVNGEEAGVTPVTARISEAKPTPITVIAPEPFDSHDLYKPFDGFITAPRPVNNISVWLDRTTAEEQAAMRADYADAQAERERELARNEVRAENFVITEFQAEWNAAGVLWVTGSVRNDGYVPAGVELRADALNADGEIVDTVHFWPASVVNIPAGGVERARYPVTTNADAQFVELTVAQAKRW